MIYQNATFLNTSDSSYCGEILVSKKYFLVPYINIQLMSGNPINEITSYVSHSYCIFENYIDVRFDSRLNLSIASLGKLNQTNSVEEYILLSGFKKGYEVKIKCDQLCFFLPADSIIKKTNFSPYDTPYFKQDMDSDFVRDFIRNKKLPLELKDIIGDDYLKLEI